MNDPFDADIKAHIKATEDFRRSMLLKIVGVYLALVLGSLGLLAAGIAAATWIVKAVWNS